jgi:predicted molibdopterin-dependent oxidoreductase YjgC
MFKKLPDADPAAVTVVIDGEPLRVPASFTAAAAVVLKGGIARTTPVSGSPRAPYCMMGVCFDCLMEIDGVPNRQACLVPVAEGMRIDRQRGARKAES